MGCEAHAKVVIEEFDDDGNNKLDFDEFLCLFASQVCYNSVIFKEFDKDNSGYVELDEICEVLGVGPKQAQVLLEKFDADETTSSISTNSSDCTIILRKIKCNPKKKTIVK